MKKESIQIAILLATVAMATACPGCGVSEPFSNLDVVFVGDAQCINEPVENVRLEQCVSTVESDDPAPPPFDLEPRDTTPDTDDDGNVLSQTATFGTDEDGLSAEPATCHLLFDLPRNCVLDEDVQAVEAVTIVENVPSPPVTVALTYVQDPTEAAAEACVSELPPLTAALQEANGNHQSGSIDDDALTAALTPTELNYDTCQGVYTDLSVNPPEVPEEGADAGTPDDSGPDEEDGDGGVPDAGAEPEPEEEPRCAETDLLCNLGIVLEEALEQINDAKANLTPEPQPQEPDDPRLDLFISLDFPGDPRDGEQLDEISVTLPLSGGESRSWPNCAIPCEVSYPKNTAVTFQLKYEGTEFADVNFGDDTVDKTYPAEARNNDALLPVDLTMGPPAAVDSLIPPFEHWQLDPGDFLNLEEEGLVVRRVVPNGPPEVVTDAQCSVARGGSDQTLEDGSAVPLDQIATFDEDCKILTAGLFTGCVMLQAAADGIITEFPLRVSEGFFGAPTAGECDDLLQ